MGDTANWEFAAAVAAVTMGLAGLLVFTISATIASWRVFGRAGRAASEAGKAAIAVQDLARYLAAREATQASEPAAAIRDAAKALGELREQASTLVEEQQRLLEAVRKLIEAGVLHREDSRQVPSDLEGSVRRLEETLNRVASAVSSLGGRSL